MKVILFTNARDENHIKEWVAYHFNLGFSFIHIFDHKSIVPIESLFKPNDKLRIKKLNIDSCIKSVCLERAINIAKSEKYDWMMYLDADEFLVLNNHTTIQEFIESYKDVNQIAINWVMFGSNFLFNDPPGLLIENYIRCNSSINMHVKPIGKVSSIKKFENPHVYMTSNMNKSVYSYDKKTMNKPDPWWYKIPDKTYIDLSVYIAHYSNQCYSSYRHRRLSRPRDDGTKLILQYSEEDLHLLDNDLINTNIRDRYAEQTKELMNEL
jgi:hypothetical protein